MDLNRQILSLFLLSISPTFPCPIGTGRLEKLTYEKDGSQSAERYQKYWHNGLKKINKISRCSRGEIGRHAGLRSQCQKHPRSSRGASTTFLVGITDSISQIQ